ncbi:hypothetical protein BB560_001851 [Smittium megazygosporum]|uniref:Lipoprotein n=1 Tax=Smittium megazygosporum TaxID=133381 RepID=A0A2T9ZGE0_9FUNG|nr:hypothetical protein BB560_001851 [Smittium megazygosporum]
MQIFSKYINSFACASLILMGLGSCSPYGNNEEYNGIQNPKNETDSKAENYEYPASSTKYSPSTSTRSVTPSYEYNPNDASFYQKRKQPLDNGNSYPSPRIPVSLYYYQKTPSSNNNTLTISKEYEIYGGKISSTTKTNNSKYSSQTPQSSYTREPIPAYNTAVTGTYTQEDPSKHIQPFWIQSILHPHAQDI